MIKINGESVAADNQTLKEYVENNGYQINRIAVEVNGNIIPKSQYCNTVLNAGDSVEVVNFVGGG